MSPLTAVPSVISNVVSFYSTAEVKNLVLFLISSFTSSLKFSPLPNSVTRPKMSDGCVIFPPLHCSGRGCFAALSSFTLPLSNLFVTQQLEKFLYNADLALSLLCLKTLQ